MATMNARNATTTTGVRRAAGSAISLTSRKDEPTDNGQEQLAAEAHPPIGKSMGEISTGEDHGPYIDNGQA
jgi:hypothetical protein